jgi:hypothetical protein
MMKHPVTYYHGGERKDTKIADKSAVTAKDATVKPEKKGNFVKNKKGKNNYYNYEPMR